MSVYKAIVAVAADIAKTGIGKDRKNDQQGYKFRGIDDVYNELAPLLAKHGLCILPRILHRECLERVNKNGTALFYVTVDAEFDFVSAEDGTTHTVKTYGEAMDSADKATNKAMSAAYKYAAFQAFCIPTEGDNDADATSHEVKPAKAPQKPVTAPEAPKPETPPAGKDAEYIERVKAALHSLHGTDKAGALDEVERMTTFTGKDGKEVKGVRDFSKLTGKRLEILAHSLEKRMKSITWLAEVC